MFQRESELESKRETERAVTRGTTYAQRNEASQSSTTGKIWTRKRSEERHTPDQETWHRKEKEDRGLRIVESNKDPNGKEAASATAKEREQGRKAPSKQTNPNPTEPNPGRIKEREVTTKQGTNKGTMSDEACKETQQPSATGERRWIAGVLQELTNGQGDRK